MIIRDNSFSSISLRLPLTILKKRGQLKADGKTLTAEGKKRNAMTAEERAKDRASKQQKVPASEFTYNPKTNTARRKG